MQLTDKQHEKLEQMTKESGLSTKSEFVRFALFMQVTRKDG